MLYCALLSLLVAFLSISVEASTVALGLNCSSINDHLDPFTHKFVTSCTDVTFCSGPVNGTCLPKLCRRDEFPFEYADGDVPAPPMCDKESFCPDEGSGCRPLAAVGNMCQLNRDEQCARPQNWQELASSQNNNGSICIKSTCMYANVTLGLPCTLEQTTYYDNVLQINNLVSRSNCRTPSLYCHPTDLTCESTKPIGSPCSADFECEEQTCGLKGVCTDPPEKPSKVAAWQYAITALLIAAAMIVTCVMLTLVHKRHLLDQHQEVQEYYLEQISLRQSIIALHKSASTEKRKLYPSQRRPW